MYRTHRLAVAGAALLLAAPGLAACGKEDSKSDAGGSQGNGGQVVNQDEEAARAAAEKAMHAIGNKDGKTFCEMQTDESGTKPLKDNAAELDKCTKGMAMLAQAPNDKLKPFATAKVKKATVNGDTASVKRADVEGLPAETAKPTGDDDLRLKKINGTWYVDASSNKTSATGAASPTS